MSPTPPFFAISVAAELASMEIQNLRVYERHGLVTPGRTDGGTRRYTHGDVERLIRIGELLAEGLNLAGIAHVLVLEAEVARLRAASTRQRSYAARASSSSSPSPGGGSSRHQAMRTATGSASTTGR